MQDKPSECSIEGCVGPVQTRGWCGFHYQRWREYGDPLRTPPLRMNYNALGFDPRHAEVDYSTIHEWVRSHFPKTGCCEHCGATGRRMQFAAVQPGFYPRDRAGWLELCVPCHRKYDGRTGAKLSPAHIAKMRAAATGRTHTPETRAKLSAINKGKKLTPETITKMSAANKGKTLTPEHVAKIAAANRGAKRSPEALANIRAGQRKRRARERAAKVDQET